LTLTDEYHTCEGRKLVYRNGFTIGFDQGWHQIIPVIIIGCSVIEIIYCPYCGMKLKRIERVRNQSGEVIELKEI